MKKLIIILLLSPLCSKAQIHFTGGFKVADSAMLGAKNYLSNTFAYGSSTPLTIHQFTGPKTIKVFDKNQKIIAETDSCGNLKVYGDTTTVLKTIIRNFGIKVN